MLRVHITAILVPAFLWCGFALAADAPQAGIASKYVRDRGIERDPDVLMVEDYESENWVKKWQENARPERKEIETDPKVVHNGKRSLKHVFRNEYGKGGAGWMHHWWDGSDEAYLRYYFRLSKGGNWSNQKLFQLHGHPRGKRYGRGAGNRPTGYDSFSAGTGVGSPGWKNTGEPWKKVILYSYFPGQKGGYGDNVVPNQGIKPQIYEDRWYCYEANIKLNDIGKSNGSQRLWIDGRLIIDQKDMLWRKGETMVINDVMLATYTHRPPEAGKTRSFWLDSVVLARKYIGPMATEPPKPRAKPNSPARKPAATPDHAAEKAAATAARAARIYRSARNAERQGMKPIARQLYERLLKECIDAPSADDARKRLESLK